jgi:hypothetical protein
MIKISSSSLSSLMAICMLPTVDSPTTSPPWERREKRDWEEREGERNLDFNDLLIPL